MGCSAGSIAATDTPDGGLDGRPTTIGNPQRAEAGTPAVDARSSDAAPTFEPIRIACGQSIPVTDANGDVWSADEDFVGGTALVGTGMVTGTPSPRLYVGQRYGDHSTSFRYTIPLPAGSYSVRLLFSEGYYTDDAGTGERLFDVSLDGSVVLTQFNIYAAAGNHVLTAVNRTFPVTLAGAGAVTLEFDPVVADPLIDAIEITTAGADAGGHEGAPGDAAQPDAGTMTVDSGGRGNAAKVLSYLSGLTSQSTKRVLSGQHAEIWNGDSVAAAMSNVTPLMGQTGQSPAILGVVMNYVGNSGAYSIDVANSMANQWWAQSGLVEMSLYSDDPTFSSSAQGYPNGSSIPAAAFHQLTVTSSAAYRQWHSQLDTYAAELHTLTDSGNVVLLRPFIELNGGWNWYGAQNPADFVSVWQDMHDYLMNGKGLVNVLWIYNVNAFSGQYSSYYPGGAYVDIVGMDIYDSAANYVADANNGGMYSFLVSTGKPLILPEVGLSSANPAMSSIDMSRLIDIIQTSLPEVVGFVNWCQGWDLADQNNVSALLNNPWVVDLSEMPSGI